MGLTGVKDRALRLPQLAADAADRQAMGMMLAKLLPHQQPAGAGAANIMDKTSWARTSFERSQDAFDHLLALRGGWVTLSVGHCAASAKQVSNVTAAPPGPASGISTSSCCSPGVDSTSFTRPAAVT